MKFCCIECQDRDNDVARGFAEDRAWNPRGHNEETHLKFGGVAQTHILKFWEVRIGVFRADCGVAQSPSVSSCIIARLNLLPLQSFRPCPSTYDRGI